MKLGILAHGSNHFIVRGTLPTRSQALALVRHWSLIQIGGSTPPSLALWRIRSKALREHLEWAVVVPGDGKTTPAVVQLLAELFARGIAIHRISRDL